MYGSSCTVQLICFPIGSLRMGPESLIVPLGRCSVANSKLCIAKPFWAMLFAQDIRRAASRAAWTAGSNKPTRIPMIAMTTSSSTRVNAARVCLRFVNLFFIILSPTSGRPKGGHGFVLLKRCFSN